MSLTTQQKDLIVGTLLGDATMGLRTQKRFYGIKFEQKAESINYINHLYEVMEPYVGSPPEERFEKGTNRIKSIWFRTYTHDDFIFYSNLFYKVEDRNGRKISIKIVPKNIHKLLNARVLAYWFMDDGTLSNNQYYLNTQGFEKHEVQRLCRSLKYCFNLKVSVHVDRQYWRLYINAESNKIFEDLILPYLHKTFFYKIRIQSRP